MPEILKTPEFWITFVVLAILIVGAGLLKRYLKKVACRCSKPKKYAR